MASHLDLHPLVAPNPSASDALLNDVPSVKPMAFSPVTFIATSRSTHSDVMSISNTTRALEIRSKPSNAIIRARLPYNETATFKTIAPTIDPRHMTPMEKQQAAKTRARRNKVRAAVRKKKN